MINISIPADNKQLAAAIGRALQEYGTGLLVVKSGATTQFDALPGDDPVLSGLDNTGEHDGDAGGNPQLEGYAAAGDAGISADQGGDKLPEENHAIDMKGVTFFETFCAKAEKPYYASGARKGQWKKARGVTDAQYDAWYAEQLAALPPEGGSTSGDGTGINTSGAFGSGQDTPQEVIPQNCGDFMAWVSEQMVAGKIVQEDVNAAYVKLGIEMTALFPPNPDAQVKDRVVALYNELKS